MRRYSSLFLLIMLLALATGGSSVGLGGVLAAPPEQDFNNLVINARADLEQLANDALGEGARPESWTFNVNNVNSPTFIVDLWYDLELLATGILGENRPAEWVGAPSTSDPLIVIRNIRHDLELAADAHFGSGNRPAGWRGGPPIARCSRTVMNLSQVLQTAFSYNFQTPPTAVNYCDTLAAEAEQQVIR